MSYRLKVAPRVFLAGAGSSLTLAAGFLVLGLARTSVFFSGAGFASTFAAGLGLDLLDAKYSLAVVSVPLTSFSAAFFLGVDRVTGFFGLLQVI